MKLTEPEKDVAYERGWSDSLTALFAPSRVAMGERYYYLQGWNACANYRWLDLNGRGIAPDRNYRIARPAK